MKKQLMKVLSVVMMSLLTYQTAMAYECENDQVKVSVTGQYGVNFVKVEHKKEEFIQIFKTDFTFSSSVSGCFKHYEDKAILNGPGITGTLIKSNTVGLPQTRCSGSLSELYFNVSLSLHIGDEEISENLNCGGLFL